VIFAPTFFDIAALGLLTDVVITSPFFACSALQNGSRIAYTELTVRGTSSAWTSDQVFRSTSSTRTLTFCRKAGGGGPFSTADQKSLISLLKSNLGFPSKAVPARFSAREKI
jgi:hypothetical protein